MIELRTLGSLDLHGSDGHRLRSVLAQPKRVALLAYLALAQPCGFHRRDSLVALLWPELDTEHARHALRKAVYYLRQSLGEDALGRRGEEQLGIPAGVLWCDAVAFEERLAAGQAAEAMALYRGELLGGFHVDEAPEFERWLDGERDRLRRRAAQAAADLVRPAEAAGSPAAAVEWARRAVELGQEDEPALRRLMALLERMGDRVGAVRTWEEYRHRLAEDYGLTPSAATERFVEELHERMKCTPGPAPVRRAASAVPSSGMPAATGAGPRLERAPSGADAPAPATAVVPARVPPPPSPAERSLVSASRRIVMGGSQRSRRGSWLGVGASVVALTAAAFLVTNQLRSHPARAPVIAVGWIRDYSAPDSSHLSNALADMLSTNLARVEGLHVLSTARMYELAGGAGEASGPSAAMLEAAKRGGATDMVEGALYRRPDGGLRLDVRRVSLAGGTVRAAHTVEGENPFELVDRATVEIAAEFDRSAAGLRVTDVTTTSLVAYGLYEQGLTEYYQHGDASAGYPLFQAALAEDSAFAMAAFYAWRSARVLQSPAADALGAQAVRLARRTTDRARLMIMADWDVGWAEPAGLVAAESLTARYPNEPDGHYALGLALGYGGDFLGAIAHLRRVVAMDSAGVGMGSPLCRACDALVEIHTDYLKADSLAAAERTDREYVRMQPHSGAAWGLLAGTLGMSKRYGEARAAWRTASHFVPAQPASLALQTALLALQAGDYAEADSALVRLTRDGDASIRGDASWYLIISWRYQGRLREALSLARRVRAQGVAKDNTGRGNVTGAVPEAVVRFELGDFRTAAAQFDSIAARPGFEPWQTAMIARYRAWMLTHEATALAAAGDTMRLASLADSIETIGRRSAYGRDHRLYHYVRGLRLLAAARPREAEAELRLAVYSWTLGYTRTNYELARLLLATDRPREAVAALQPALRGALDASNFYITRTEIHEILARAFDAAGQVDSAADHYREVVRAWRRADPQFYARRTAAQARLDALERRR